MDKNQAMIDYLFQCPLIAENPLFFNFSEAEDNNKQIVTNASDIAVEKPYIDGSVSKRYLFSIIDYRSVVYQPLVNASGYSNENVDELFDVQSLIDWISTQDDNRNYPNFGNNCIIDSIKALTDSPLLNGVDTKTNPALAKYSVAIQVDYLDTSKMLWG